MIKREVIMPAELIKEIFQIVQCEEYTALKNAFPNSGVSPVFLSEKEAEALIILAVIEKKKAWLKYPHYDDEEFDNTQMEIYEKTIYYVASAFKKGSFNHLI